MLKLFVIEDAEETPYLAPLETFSEPFRSSSMAGNRIPIGLSKDLPRFKVLTETVSGILKVVLDESKVHYFSIERRTKERASIAEKIIRKGYSDPKVEMTDISGIRVLLYLESDIARVQQVIEATFQVFPEMSSDKGADLLTNKVGYRSAHFVCELGRGRLSLPEHQKLSGLKCEIQVRTLLQHAWAEISHDRSYKFTVRLPDEWERELFLYSGLLEIADRGFSSLNEKIGRYVSEIQAKTKAGKFDIALDSVSLVEFVNSWTREHSVAMIKLNDKEASSRLVRELEDFGVNSLEKLRAIIPERYAGLAKQEGYITTIYGLIRDWMLLHDWNRYLKEAWKGRWNGFGDLNDEGGEAFYKVYHALVGPEDTDKILQTFVNLRQP